ncbi:protein argonaute-2 [Procambarus clarkii]|uniref:protein argonaute-2 n=1 Tax=Procambarus clarkii TaxID=6728 RepID=UPI003741E8B5
MMEQSGPEVLRPPPRTAAGQQGEKISLDTNFFPVTMRDKSVQLVHYDVSLKVHKQEINLPRRLKLDIFEKMKNNYAKVFKDYPLAFDSESNAYSSGVIPGVDGKCFEVQMEGRDGAKQTFTVYITVKHQCYLHDLMKALNYTPGEHQVLPAASVQMMEVMFRHYRALKYELVGRRNFYPMGGEFGAPYPIGVAKQGVIGFFGSMRPASWKDGSMLLNIDVAHTAFYKDQPLLEFVQGVVDLNERDLCHPLEPKKLYKLRRELMSLRVQVTHSNIPRTYKIIAVSELGSDKQTFPLKDDDTGKIYSISVESYIKNNYGRKLKYPKFNCIQVAPAERRVYLPVEICKLSRQRVGQKLSDRETAQFIRTTAVPPADRIKKIRQIYHSNDFAEDPMLQSLQLTIGDKPLELSGRVLATPQLLMDAPVEPVHGVWDIRRRSFFKPTTIHSWAVFNYCSRQVSQREVDEFLRNLMKMGTERGISFNNPVRVMNIFRPVPEHDLRLIRSDYNNLQLVLVILGKGDDLYARVKKAGDMEMGVLTQCVQCLNVKDFKFPTLSNILLKINAKIGGINSIISPQNAPMILRKPAMIMGADVNHPAAGDAESPSLAAVVASFDRNASKYAVEVRYQEHREELIQDLKQMMKNLLMTFYRECKKMKPEKIVMYRDGVSDTQFQGVLTWEMAAMRGACNELEPNYNPGITFLVVQKRHHTRLFCKEKQGVGKCKNIPPGTVVDVGITHPHERDFYLCSHQGIQGTSKPTHYHILWDDNNMSMDELQSLTYSMCHLYSRCTRAVSLPSPAYYAHLAAFRAKVHLNELCNNDDASESVSQKEIEEAVTVNTDTPVSNKLYYV